MNVYILLFFVSFLAATILPVSSELMLLALISDEKNNIYFLIAIASCANILGSVVNYYLGVYINNFRNKKWFPVSGASLEKAEIRFERYGVYCLFFAWVPFIGDPLTVLAGTLKTKFSVFLLFVSIGKILRYIFIVLVFNSVI